MLRKYLLILSFVVCSLAANSQNYVSTYSGNGNPGFKNGAVDTAQFNGPFGMCIDKNNNLYIADGGNNCIRKINTATGIVSTLAGTGVQGWKDGPADSAKFNGPSDVCVDDSGNVYVSDFSNHRIRKISAEGIVSTVAGNGMEGYVDGIAESAEFDYPRGICRDTSGNLYVSDSWNHRIRKISSTGVVSTYAGGGTAMGVGSVGSLVDANDTSARFYTPSGLTIDRYGNIYVADAYNHRIRKISVTQNVTTFAGNGTTGPNIGMSMDGDSDIAMLNTPTEVFADKDAEELYIGETFGNRVRRVNMLTKEVNTYAGDGLAGFDNDIDSFSTFNYPRGVVVDTSGNKVYVVDFNNHAIRLIAPQATTGLVGFDFANSLMIYPNPSHGLFSIIGLPVNVQSIQVFDVIGNKVKELRINRALINIDLSSFPKGVYLLKIAESSGNSLIRKVVTE